VRRAILEMRDREFRERSGHALADLVLRPAELQRPEGEFVENRRTEELDVGVLKAKAISSSCSRASDRTSPNAETVPRPAK
jgi:hypothetical protein